MTATLVTILLFLRLTDARNCRPMGHTCTATTQCCATSGQAFCHPPTGLCTWCPNNGHECASAADCCPGGAYGQAYCNSTLGFCIGCKGLGDPCGEDYDSCCMEPGLVCRGSDPTTRACV